MAKITLSDISNITGREINAISTINDNNQSIEVAIENTLSRDGTSPNAMNSDFDMNGNDILNASNIDTNSLTINGEVVVPGSTINADTLLTAIKTVDGSDSGLDSDTVDGSHSSAFQFHDGTISDISTTTFPAINPKQIRPVGFSVVDPYVSRWKRISTPSPVKAWHKQSLDGQWWQLADGVVHPFMFGNVGIGNDDTDAFQQCATLLAASSPAICGKMDVPRGDYQIDDVSFTEFSSAGAGHNNFLISGYGAHLVPRSGGSFGGSLFKVVNASTTIGSLADLSIKGFFFDEAVATSHDNALYIQGTQNVHLSDLTIAGWGTGGGDRTAIELVQGATSALGSFWNTSDNVTVRKSGSQSFAYGFKCLGENNDLKVRNFKVNTGAGGVGMFFQPVTALANHVIVEGSAFEDCLRSIWVNVSNGDCPQGYSFLNNRNESISNIAYLFDMISGSPSVNPNPPIIGPGNTYIGVSHVMEAIADFNVQFRDQRNYGGLATIANGNSTIAVTFPVQEYSDNYSITTSGVDDTTIRTISQTDGGFTIKRTGTTGAVDINWSLHPRSL